VHPGTRHLLGDGQRDRAGPRAQVDDDGLGHVHLAQPVDGPARHHLGFGAWHEHTRADLELEVAEVGPPRDVLQRLAGGAAPDPLPEARVERRIGHSMQLGPPHAMHMRGDQLGLGPG